ncbi:MAG: thioesterase family protein [Pseudomonadota bacterium]
MTERNFRLDACLAPEVSAGVVRPEWIDVNGHMNVAWYLLAFDEGIDGLWNSFGLTDAYRDATGSSTFAVESHVRYLNELMRDEPFVVHAQIIAYDDKRLHQYQYLFSSVTGKLSATCEWLHLHVDLRSRRVAPWPQLLADNIAAHPCSLVASGPPAGTGRAMHIAAPTGPAEQRSR